MILTRRIYPFPFTTRNTSIPTTNMTSMGMENKDFLVKIQLCIVYGCPSVGIDFLDSTTIRHWFFIVFTGLSKFMKGLDLSGFGQPQTLSHDRGWDTEMV